MEEESVQSSQGLLSFCFWCMCVKSWCPFSGYDLLFVVSLCCGQENALSLCLFLLKVGLLFCVFMIVYACSVCMHLWSKL